MDPIPNSLRGPIPGGRSRNGTMADPSRPLFFVLTFLALFRLCVPDSVLNLLMSYSTEGGNLLEKVHPASWLFLVLAAILAPRIAGLTAADDRRILRAMLTMVALIVVASIVPFLGPAASSLGVGYLLDSLVVAALAACTALLLPVLRRRGLGEIVLTVLVLNSLMAMAEFALKQQFLPSAYREWVFRSKGIFGHPLDLGLANATAVSFVYLTKWSSIRKVISIALLIAATLAAGARTASIVGIAAALLSFLLKGGPPAEASTRRQIKIIVLLAVVLLSPVLWALVYATGLIDRFELLGLADESAETRVIVFHVFDYIEWHDLIFGAGLETLNRIALTILHLPTVENSVIVFIFQFGLVGTACLIGGFLYALFVLACGSTAPIKIALFSFLAVALAANSLSIKTPEIMLVFILAIAFRHQLVPSTRNAHFAHLAMRTIAPTRSH